MLQELLKLIEQGQQFSQVELAEKMGVNPFLLNSMLQQLVNMGYLEDLNCSDSDGCSGCPAKSACFTKTSSHLWSLTEKGFKAAQKNLE